MAKTATLNGGATGGLHANTTPILHSSEEEESHPNNPNNIQQRQLPTDDNDNDASCRGVDSNSSFDSGHEDGGGGGSHNIIPRPQATTSPSDDMSRWSTSYNNNTTTKHSSSNSIQQYYNKEDKESEGRKKGRKQSRPVRIPASELLDNPQLQQQSETGPTTTTTTNDSTVRMVGSNESSTPRHPRRLSMDNDEDDDDDDNENINASSDLDDNNDDDDENDRNVNSSNRDNNNSRNRTHHQKFMGKVRKSYQTPLNLSKDPEDDEENIPSHLSTHPNLPFHESLQFQLQQQQQQLQHHLQLQLNSSSTLDNEKTDISGQGTKDSQQQHRNASSNSNPSFSPGLFPLIGSSPFFSFFPSGQTGQLPTSLQQLQNQLQQHQQQQQQQQHSSNNPQSGNNSSSSSTGSNQHHHHHNNNNILGSTNNSNTNPATTPGGLTLQNIPPHRIFNPEAYCDLCNKEFCNKYFLKTHKANKHGVYSENPPTSNQGGIGSQNMGGSGSTSILPPSSQVVMAAAAALSVSSSPSTPFHSTPAATPANLVCASVPSQQQQSHHHHQQQQQQLLHLTSLGLNPSQTAKANSMMAAMMENEAALSLEHKGGGNSNGSQSAASSRESFCDLCQKEFCNKYFLKRHKAKIHGIPMEQSMSSRSSSSGKNINPSQNHPMNNTNMTSMNQNNLNSNSSNNNNNNGRNNTSSTGSSNVNRALNFTNGLTNDNGRLPLMMMGSELESLGLELVAKHIEEEEEDDGGVEEGEVEHGHGNSNEPGQIRLMKESNERRDRDRERQREREKERVGEVGDEDDDEEDDVDNNNDDDDDNDRDRPASDDDGRSPYNNNNKISSLHQQLNMGMNMKIPLGLPQLNETTCQFCYREFSNKTLLRSHIMKKHRLLLPTFPPFMLPFHPQQQSSTGSQIYDENQQDSEQGPIGMDYSKIAATAMMMGLGGSAIGNVGQDSEASGKESGGEVDYECTQCGRSFQTIYLLRMHKSYFHPESDDMSDITAAAAAAVTKMEENSDIEESDTAPASVLPSQMTDSDNNKIMGGRIPGLKSQGGQDSDRENEQDMEQGDDNDNNNNEDEDEEEEEAEATSDSDDLRRLQTMIMELNRVSSANPPASWSPPLDSARSNSQSRSPAINSSNNMTNTTSTTTTMSSGMNNSTACICPMCSKEFYSAYFLQQHLQQYHGINNNNSSSNNTKSNTNSGNSGDVLKSESPDMQLISNMNKKLMSGESFDNNNSISGLHLPHQQGKDKDKHGKDSESGIDSSGGGGGGMGNPLTSVLGLGIGNPSSFLTPSSAGHKSSSSPLTPIPKGDGMLTPTGSGGSNSGKRPSPSLSRSYCTICHKELCNKYFMRTHMLKMHGISIESSTGLGGVTCDICHKELCSKYFLKVHKQNTHGIIDDGPSPPNPSTPGPMGLSLPIGPSSSPSDGSRESPSLSTAMASSQGDLVPLLSNNPMDLQSRYFCHYSEVCPFCGRRFRSAKWLKTHLLADHGPDGKERWKAIEKSLQLQQHTMLGSGSGISGGNITSSSSSSNHPSSMISSNRRPPSKLSASSTSGGGDIRDRDRSLGGSGGGGGTSSSGHHHTTTSSISGSGLSKSGQKSTSSFSSSSKPGPYSSSTQKSGSGSGQLSSSSISGGNAGNKCALCGFTTLDMDIMKIHLIKEHASQLAGADPTEANLNLNLASYQDSQRGVGLDPLTLLFQKMEGGTNKMYRCAYCPFTTSLLVYLYAHERTHQQQQQQSGNSPKPNVNSTEMQQGGGATFQCPICFHTFQQLETFQQHLIGHQMSGVLAPFSAPSTSGCLAFLNNTNSNNNPESPTSLEQQQQQQQQAALASLSLPLLNGAMTSSGDSLYWALKNSGASLGSSLGLGLGLQGMTGNNGDGGENMRGDHGSSPLMLDGKQMIKTESSSSPVNMAMSMSMTGGLNPILPASLSTEIRGGGSHSGQNQSQSQRSNSNNNSNNEDEQYDEHEGEQEHASKTVEGRTVREKTGKRRRSQSVMDDDDEDENDESVLLISSRVVGKRRKRGKISSFRCSFCQMTFPSRFDCSTHIEQSHSVRRRKKKRSFRCRKCKFTSNRYQKLVIHNRLHHSSTLRGFQMSKDESSRGGSRLMSWNKFSDEGDMRPGTGISNPLPTQSQRRASSWNLESLPQGRAIPIQPAVLGEYMMQGFLLSCSNTNEDDEELSTEEATMKNRKGQQNTLSDAPLPPSTSTTSVPLDKTNAESIESENSKGSEGTLKNSETDPGSTNSTALQGESSDESIQNSKMTATVATTAAAVITTTTTSSTTTTTSTGTIETPSPSNPNQRNICANLNSTQELFVPSLVYLPVREKVSHSLRVSFSLTPTS